MSITFDDIHTSKKQQFLSQTMEKTTTQLCEVPNPNPKLFSCPVCGSSTIHDFTYAYGFNMSQCEDCQLIFCNPYPSSKQIEAYYNSSMKEFENEFFRDSFEKRVDLFLPRVKLIQQYKTSGDLLDIGSAIGVFHEALHRCNTHFHITSCDINPSACEELQRRYPETATICADILELNESKKFDIITLWDTIEHIVDPNALITKISKLLRPQGILVFSTPNTDSFEWHIAGTNHVQILPPGHVNLFNKKSIRALLGKHHFHINSSQTLNPSLDIGYVKKLLIEDMSYENKIGTYFKSLLNEPDFAHSFCDYLIKKHQAGNILVIASQEHEKVLASRESNLVLNEGYSLAQAPLIIKKAAGAHLTTTNEKQVLDYSMAAGSAILGHAPSVIRNTLKKQADCGTAYLLPTEEMHRFSEKLNQVLPHFKGFAYCNSGSEATMRAMRIARAHTRKNKIAVFSGGWHGSHDGALWDDDPTSSDKQPSPSDKSSGLPSSLKDLIIMLPYDRTEAFHLIEQNRDQLAAVMIEPVQGSLARGDKGIESFLKELAQTTKENDILLCFDEIITGFRLALAGGIEYFDIQPDIATYGKIIGGGLPIGIVGVTESLRRTIQGPDNLQAVFLGGTFSANPMSLAAGDTMLTYLIDNPDIYEILNTRTRELANIINHFTAKADLPIHISSAASMFRINFCKEPPHSRRERDRIELPQNIQQLFYHQMLKAGIYLKPGRSNFISLSHDQKLITETIETTIRVLKDMQKQGLFDHV
ncbi:MAG: aminotransferase class III-fold pyridoxal phosphate-dependent enzyme [Verrucomicrobiota bacterium]